MGDPARRTGIPFWMPLDLPVLGSWCHLFEVGDICNALLANNVSHVEAILLCQQREILFSDRSLPDHVHQLDGLLRGRVQLVFNADPEGGLIV